MDNLEKQQNQTESKKARRSLSKFNKEVPRYECFCAKQYLSYPALYLHLKNKHHNYFQNSKNGKKIETTKLIESFDSHEGFKVYKISIESINSERQKHNQVMQSAKQMEAQGFTENPLYYAHNNYLAYGNTPFQYQYDYLLNKEQSSPLTKDASVQNAFSMFFQSLNINSAKQKAQTQLLLGLLVCCINENYTILKQHGEQMQYKRYTSQQNCKHLSLFLSFFQKKWLPQAIKQENKYYSFFVKNSSIIVQGKYKRLLEELLQFVDGQRYQDISELEILKSRQPCLLINDNSLSHAAGNNEIPNGEPKNKLQQNQLK